MLGFIETLDHPELFGVNPEVAHEEMAGLNTVHSIAQALHARKLFHIHLNAQKPGRFDQDLRFGSENLKGAFFLVKLLEDAGYEGPKELDCHAYRTEDEDGVWDFAAGCMRSYLILKEKVRKFNEDTEIQAILDELQEEGEPVPGKYSKERAMELRDMKLDPEELSKRILRYEKLDQLVFELITGVR